MENISICQIVIEMHGPLEKYGTDLEEFNENDQEKFEKISVFTNLG
jgi:hypothetical protein